MRAAWAGGGVPPDTGGACDGRSLADHLDGQAEGDAGPDTHLAVDRDLSVEQHEQVAHQREAEARAPVARRGCVVHLEELVEQELPVVRTDPDAGVAHVAGELSAAHTRLDLDP